jgi:hypothetical protein
MDIVVFDSPELFVALGALHALHAEETRRQLRLLGALARLHGASIEPSLLPRCTPRHAAGVIRDPHRRKRLVQLAVLMALVDGQVQPETAEAVAELACTLGTDEPGVRVLGLLAARRVLAVRIALMRRIMGRFLREAYRGEGWRGVCKILGALFLKGARDAATAARYRNLEHLPSGSFGRALWEYAVRNAFALPGEAGAIPERVLFHDMGHVLSGYDTNPAGEIRQAAFQAGFVRHDGFAFLLFAVLQFHHGIKITPVAEPEVGYFDVEAVLYALARGAACRVDLSDGFQFWLRAACSIEQVRAELGIAPVEDAPNHRAA